MNIIVRTVSLTADAEKAVELLDIPTLSFDGGIELLIPSKYLALFGYVPDCAYTQHIVGLMTDDSEFHIGVRAPTPVTGGWH